MAQSSVKKNQNTKRGHLPTGFLQQHQTKPVWLCVSVPWGLWLPWVIVPHYLQDHIAFLLFFLWGCCRRVKGVGTVSKPCNSTFGSSAHRSSSCISIFFSLVSHTFSKQWQKFYKPTCVEVCGNKLSSVQPFLFFIGIGSVRQRFYFCWSKLLIYWQEFDERCTMFY